ncbi:HEAT repeat domain-containing protein, partial [Streptococcus pseudopneumoniae]|uniref:HEAT repeat domain-containing protein n=1 Tax=Streptococcus pseudopneumoniae TaxID=257758 RepID=UPI001BB1CFBB
MDYKINEIHKILDSENKEEKIKILESLNNTDDSNLIKKIVSKLDDPDIEVRGEAFSTLISNKNEISDIIIESLNSENKNIRGFSALILANRKDSEGIESLI